jgi:hypothetical protein
MPAAPGTADRGHWAQRAVGIGQQQYGRLGADGLAQPESVRVRSATDRHRLVGGPAALTWRTRRAMNQAPPTA